MSLPGPARRSWVDGIEAPLDQARIAVADPGLLTGFGLFETLAVRSRLAVDLAEHLARLEAGASALGIALPPLERLRAVLEKAAADGEGTGCGFLKLVVLEGGRWIVISGAIDPAEEGRPASAVLLPWRRNPKDALVGLKTLNYAANVLGLREARRRGADEGLWLNVRGRLAEGCTSNLFVLSGNRLHTPALGEGILPGVVRGRVLAAARSLGLAVHEGRVRPKRLARAGEAFLSSSLRGIRPLVRVDGRAIGSGRPGLWTRRIAERVARLRGLSEDPVA